MNLINLCNPLFDNIWNGPWNFIMNNCTSELNCFEGLEKILDNQEAPAINLKSGGEKLYRVHWINPEDEEKIRVDLYVKRFFKPLHLFSGKSLFHYRIRIIPWNMVEVRPARGSSMQQAFDKINGKLQAAIKKNE